MFTGIIQHVGTVEAIESERFGKRLWIELGPIAASLKSGDSVAVNGVCLTAAKLGSGASAGFDAVAETLGLTKLGDLSVGSKVNLEAALRMGDGLDGHIVQGHVDGVASVSRIDKASGQWNIHFGCGADLTEQMVTKGSVAIDGVSLTLVSVTDKSFSVTVIPTTLEETTLARLSVGDKVNIETDVLGKYILKMLAKMTGGKSRSSGGVTMETLRQAGFMD